MKFVQSLTRFVPAIALLAAAPAFATNYQVDGAHSTVAFSVKHMAISTVNGHFNTFSGDFTFDPTTGVLGNSKFEVKTDSIDSGNGKRDEHLKSPDFFDVAKYPTMTLTDSKIKKTGKDKYDWDAQLTLHGVTKPVKFVLEYTGSAKGMQGETRAAFNASTTIKRSDWNLKWNKALEAGGVMVSDEVKLSIDVEAIADAKVAAKK